MLATFFNSAQNSTLTSVQIFRTGAAILSSNYNVTVLASLWAYSGIALA
jgi:hypothetical protein